MHSELTNLLPLERQRALSRDYVLRFSVVAMVILIILTLAATVLLVPTYVFLRERSTIKEKRLAEIKSMSSPVNEKELSTRLATLADNVKILAALADTPSVSTTIRTILAVSRPGITLSNFVYTPPVAESPGILVVSGSSKTRDALRNYQLALRSAPTVLSVDLPISAYAKDADISFTVTITLAP